MPDDIHALWIEPMAGVAEKQRVVVATDKTSVVILLPDNSRVLITADRAVYIQGRQVVTLSQWQVVLAEVEDYVVRELGERDWPEEGADWSTTRRPWPSAG
jgi:hypothetical protein